MPTMFPEITRFSGLHLQANSFTVPDGSMETANNVVLSKDFRISKRRGFYQYFDPSSLTLNALSLFQGKLLCTFSDRIAYFTDTGTSPNFTGTKTDLTGATVAVSGGRISRSIQMNKNFYFTTNNGVLKLENYNGTVQKSGTPPGLDLRGTFLSQNGVVDGDTQVSWRVVFGRRDANDNLLLGSPSDILTLTSSKTTGVAWSRAANVVTVTSASNNLTPGMLVVISNALGGTPNVAPGSYTVLSASSTTFTFAETAANTSGTLDWTVGKRPRLEFSVPTEITSTTDGYFYQVYRSSQSLTSSTLPFSDFKLVDEQKLTAANIAADLVFYEDDTDDLILGAELYTNPNSREGELQANDRAPLCDDMTVYKNHAVYAKCTTRGLINLQVVDPSAMVAGDFVEVKVGATTRRYVARGGVANANTHCTSVTGTTTIVVTYNGHGLLAGDTVYISRVTGTLTEGTYTLTLATANTFTFVATAGQTASDLDFMGVTNGTYAIFQLVNASGSVSVNLSNTAKGLVKAINRDTSSLVYARYISGTTDIPGKVLIQAKGFDGTVYLRANTTAAGGLFSPILPASFSVGDQVFSRSDDQPNAFYVSKIGEPEAVPLVNYFTAGARNQDISRIVALRDSLIIIKTDGVFRMTGDSPANFTITALDNTIFCAAPNSVSLINNQACYLSNQGVCLVNESSVQIISRVIEDVIQPILGLSTVGSETCAVAYESERFYILSTLEPSGISASQVYVFNNQNQSWVTWDTTFKNGVLGPNDTLYLVTTGNKIAKERKTQSLIDYCGQNYDVTVTSVASDKLSAVLSTGSISPTVGDTVVKSGVFNKIKAVSGAAGTFTVTFIRQTNLITSDAAVLYSGFTSEFKLSPFHAGLVGRAKQFSQMQIHMRENGMSSCFISFTGYAFGGSEIINWRQDLIKGGQAAAGLGFGAEPWGFFAFGEDDATSLRFSTQAAPVVRVYVPRFQQRGTFIQPIVRHINAGEGMDLQAMSFAVRSYQERVTS